MKKLILLLSLIFLSCGADKPGTTVDLENFLSTRAEVQVLRGDVFCGNPVKPLHKTWLAGEGEIISTGDGEVLITHENGVKVELTPVSKATITRDRVVITGGGAIIFFPKGYMAETEWKGWKLRGSKAGVQIVNGKRSSINVFRGELLAEFDGQRYIIKAGNALHTGEKVEVKPIEWWEPGNGISQWEAGDEDRLVPGQGVLGARKAGDKGKAHIPLLINKMKAKVEVIGDLAITTITQEFYNPTSDVLEGIYRFEAPEGALINGFAVDRERKLVFGIIKGKVLAKQQYQSNVYQGSTEDPALLEHEEGNRYRAYIYPINPGQKRQILIRYSSWLERSGKNREVRNYTLPLIGSDDSSPEYGEFEIDVDLRQSRAKTARANLGVTPDGSNLEFKATDFTSRSDFHVQLTDDGFPVDTADGWYVRPIGRKQDIVKGDYFFTRLYPLTFEEERSRSVDLLMVVDFSADTTLNQISLARLAVETAVSTLRKGDRVAIVPGDLTLRDTEISFFELGKAQPVEILERLAREKKGGATDILELITKAGKKLTSFDSHRARILLYIGNGKPTVGEISPRVLAEKWQQLPYNVGFRAIATEDGEGLELLSRLAPHHSPLLLSEVGVLRELPVFINDFRKPRIHKLTVTADGDIGKLFPRGEITWESSEVLNVSAKLKGTKLPKQIVLKGELNGKPWSRTFGISWSRFTDQREIARRWAYEEIRSLQLAGASGEEILDLGMRFEMVTPFTSLYVPTMAEAKQMGLNLEDKEEADRKLAKAEEKPKEIYKTEKKSSSKLRMTRGLKEFGKASDGPGDSGGKTLKDFARKSMGADSDDYSVSVAAKSEPKRDKAPPKPTAAPSIVSTMMPMPQDALSSTTVTNESMPTEKIKKRPIRQFLVAPDTGNKLDGLVKGGGGAGGLGFTGGGEGFGKMNQGKLGFFISNGRADRETLKKNFERRAKVFARRCSTKHLKNNPGGTALMIFKVSDNGFVDNCKVMRDVGTSGVGRCMCDGIRKIRFNETRGKGPSLVRASWAFTGKTPAKEAKKEVKIPGLAAVGYPAPTLARINPHIVNNYIFCRDCNFKRKPDPCSPASKLPLWQRANLWRERINKKGHWQIIEVYNDAIRLCEMPVPHSRMVFLRLAVSMLPKVDNLISFYKKFVPLYGYSSFLKSAILARIKDIDGLLKVKRDLGLTVLTSRNKITEMLEAEKTADGRIMLLKKMIKENPGDSWLKIRLLHTFEDEKMHGKAKTFIASFYGNPLLDDELRHETTEYLIRQKDIKNARRLLSELVEFAPSNPLRRKVLGQLYLAYGWYKLAVRELISLAKLTAGSANARLLLAVGYELAGEHEKSLTIIGEIMLKSEPDSDITNLSRFIASRHLARMIAKSGKGSASRIHDRGRIMALYRNNEKVKIILSYQHPRSDLEFTWGPSTSSMMRVPFIKPDWGIEAVVMSKVPDSAKLKIARTSKNMRMPVKAELLVIQNEGTDKESITRKELAFDSKTTEYVFTFEKGNLK
ncbi:hypothetical protein KKF34_15505 [Myxococcota bacterium]|nr:hypothetical protein [Myxococcota bacterium]MBU1382741.1 hypothetical protein [Myxococcota bacterium]MBU1498281.1 hypothetical protein [Myxococcota bacterium]